jgi:hypothetical protein
MIPFYRSRLADIETRLQQMTDTSGMLGHRHGGNSSLGDGLRAMTVWMCTLGDCVHWVMGCAHGMCVGEDKSSECAV